MTQMHILLEDGTEWKFRSDGTMEQIAWSQASSKCQSNPFPADGAVAAPGGCRTAQLPLVGAPKAALNGAGDGKPLPLGIHSAPGLHMYGTEGADVMAMPGTDRVLGNGLTEAMVRFAARFEYARTVEDVLARRARILFLDAKLAASLAPAVAAILQEETGVDPKLDDFLALAKLYLTLPD